MDGETQWINCRNFTREEISKWLELLRTQQTNHVGKRYRKLWYTDYPSIQGPWTPFTFRDPKLNLAEYPNEDLSQPHQESKTATEELIELFKKQQLDQENVKNVVAN